MHAEDRIIHFSTELIHRSTQHDVKSLQKLYYELSQTSHANYQSTDFSRPNQARFYSRRGKGTQSLALFLPDRILLMEEWADIALSEFLAKLDEVAGRAMVELGITEFTAQTVTLRSTFALTAHTDARVFLLERVCQQQDKIGPYFQRPVSVGGLRFVLPETPKCLGTLNVVIESFRQSAKEVFVEVKGVYQSERVGPDEMQMLKDRFFEVRKFISENIFAYLNQFDVSGTE